MNRPCTYRDGVILLDGPLLAVGAVLRVGYPGHGDEVLDAVPIALLDVWAPFTIAGRKDFEEVEGVVYGLVYVFRWFVDFALAVGGQVSAVVR